MTEFKIPKGGEKIEVDAQGKLRVPDRPVIPFIEGDGTGPDIWRASQRVPAGSTRWNGILQEFSESGLHGRDSFGFLVGEIVCFADRSRDC